MEFDKWKVPHLPLHRIHLNNENILIFHFNLQLSPIILHITLTHYLNYIKSFPLLINIAHRVKSQGT